MSEFDEQSANDEAIGRIQGYGCMWLNSAFVANDTRSRVFRRIPGLKAVRLGKVEAIWIALSLAVLSPSLWLIFNVLDKIPGLGNIVTPFVGVLVGAVLSWPVGRHIARVSPYRRYSGEGLTEFLYVQSNKRHSLIGRLFGRSVAVTRCETFVSGKREVMDCIEWVGTARAKFMPSWDPDDPREDFERMFVDVYIPPRHVPVDWVDRVRARRRLAGSRRG